MDYQSFIKSRQHSKNLFGFNPIWTPGFLFDFQKEMFRRSCVFGRFAEFADCGLGKTPMQLSWSQNVVMKTNCRVLIITPLSVGAQTVSEGEKFGIECEQSRDGRFSKKIVITNYERLHYFNPIDFDGVVCDESSILKNYKGKVKSVVTEFLKKIKYRLLCTATAAPNDFIELGTSSEALGCLGYTDMISRFFKNARNTCDNARMYGGTIGAGAPKFALRGHAEKDFWRWVASWSVAARTPSDLGFDNGKFILPELIENQHEIENTKPLPGKMFVEPAVGMREERQELRMTINARCEKAAELADHEKPCVIWCNLDHEGDLLAKIIPDAVQVHGRMKDEKKEEIISDFSSGKIRVLITKSKISGFGMNWQHCDHTIMFPSHSFEQYYQSIRRFWRFGQKNTVTADMVTTPALRRVLGNLQRKSRASERMFEQIVKYMNDAKSITEKPFDKKMEIPSWMSMPN